MISRAWYLLGGIALAVALAGSGYYLGRARTLDRWQLERAALADSADSARARAARASHALTDAGHALDSLLVAYAQLADRPPRVITVHDATTDTVRDTVPVASMPSVPLPTAAPDTSTAGRLRACDAVVLATVRYRTACEAVRDSLSALNATLAQQLAARASAPRQRPIGVAIGPSLTLAPDSTLTGPWRVRPGISVTIGWLPW